MIVGNAPVFSRQCFKDTYFDILSQQFVSFSLVKKKHCFFWQKQNKTIFNISGDLKELKLKKKTDNFDPQLSMQWYLSLRITLPTFRIQKFYLIGNIG